MCFCVLGSGLRFSEYRFIC
uniref:Uncharacterized protein n=1 Tax=Romanomermis culicivorax TaxID=13658 RepID=A0A915JE33_ROMCU